MNRRHRYAWSPAGVLALCFALQAQAATSPAAELPATIHACTLVASSLARLTCFDTAAGTPLPGASVTGAPGLSRPAFVSGGSAAAPEIVGLMQANEAARKAENSGFLISESAERDDAKQQRVIISAPALGALPPRPYLVVSCLSNISRLQLVLGTPIAQNIVQVHLLLDDHSLSAAAPWQVLNQGLIVDAGRGVPGIDTIRHLASGARLHIQSDEQQLDGLVFDAGELGPLIAQQRKACHW